MSAARGAAVSLSDSSGEEPEAQPPRVLLKERKEVVEEASDPETSEFEDDDLPEPYTGGKMGPHLNKARGPSRCPWGGPTEGGDLDYFFLTRGEEGRLFWGAKWDHDDWRDHYALVEAEASEKRKQQRERDKRDRWNIFLRKMEKSEVFFLEAERSPCSERQHRSVTSLRKERRGFGSSRKRKRDRRGGCARGEEGAGGDDPVIWRPGRCVNCGKRKLEHPDRRFCTLPRDVRAKMRRSMLRLRGKETRKGTKRKRGGAGRKKQQATAEVC
jgi:hypothetical protein